MAASSALRRDLERWVGSTRPLPALAVMKKAAAYPGVQAVVLLRLQIALSDRAWTQLARVVSAFNLKLTGAHFGVGCRVGSGLMLPHPQGVVVGMNAVIGDGCTIYHRVTLGERVSLGRRPAHACPVVGRGVVIGVGAAVLGGVRVGDNAMIGANAVVLADVEAGDVVVGVPARSTRRGSPDDRAGRDATEAASV